MLPRKLRGQGERFPQVAHIDPAILELVLRHNHQQQDSNMAHWVLEEDLGTRSQRMNYLNDMLRRTRHLRDTFPLRMYLLPCHHNRIEDLLTSVHSHNIVHL